MNRPNVDWRDVSVQRERVMRDLGNIPWAPRDASPFISFRGAFVALALCCFLLGLLVVGK